MLRLRFLSIVLAIVSLYGCTSLTYYTQAVKGQLQIFARTQSIDDLLQQPTTHPDLKERLTSVLNFREFASHELGLPNNKSYRTYVDLERPYVLWNVFATPEFSFQPKEWCFVIIGCVTYRGYFKLSDAEIMAEELRRQGYDVSLAGVSAYSTLGWFNDPMLNTLINRPAAELAGIMFHEIAHQRLYVRDDTAFNESFATVVELEGVHRWLKAHSTETEFYSYTLKLKRREEFATLVLKYRDRLRSLYRSTVNETEKRAEKNKIFSELRDEFELLKAFGWLGYDGYDAWFARELNNAHILSVDTYYSYVPAFQALLAHKHYDLVAFYRAAEEIGRMPKQKRKSVLDSWLSLTLTETEKVEKLL